MCAGFRAGIDTHNKYENNAAWFLGMASKPMLIYSKEMETCIFLQLPLH